MKIPKKLKIGGHMVKILEVDKVPETSDGCVAGWENKKNTIYLLKCLPQSQKEVALIHELFHSFNAIFGDSEMSHAVLDSLAEQFYQVLKDNKLLK